MCKNTSFPRQNNFHIVLMNLIVFPLLIIMTVIGLLLSPLTFFILRTICRYDTLRISRLIVWVYGRCWLAVIKPFTGFQAKGLKKGDIPPSCIIVPNHLSFFDTFFMGALPFSNVCFAIRSWPFKIAWYRPFMKLGGYLDVESTPWEESFEACKREIQRGGAIVIFPEAHRSRDGKLGRFYSGAFKVSVATGVPVIPVCIKGTGNMYPPGQWLLRPAKVRLTALPAVYPADFPGPQGHMEMRKFVKALMAERLKR